MGLLAVLIAQVLDPIRVIVVLLLHLVVVRQFIRGQENRTSFFVAVGCGALAGVGMAMLISSLAIVRMPITNVISPISAIIWSIIFWAISVRLRRRALPSTELEKPQSDT